MRVLFFFSSRRRHTRCGRDWSSDVCSSDLAGTSVTLFPEQKFREGFSVAGDDILLRVVQAHVLPPLEAAMRSAGIANPTDLMAELVGGDRGGEDIIQRNLRQQFALQVAHPIALELMRVAEDYDPT